MAIDVQVNRFQTEFLRRLDDPLLICQTGVGTGKSEAMALWAVIMALKGESIIIRCSDFSSFR
jgi:hypothetical protein